MTTPIDIRADHLRIVQDVLRRHLPDGVKVWVFGSRATWATKDSSDLDLALEGNGEIPARSLTALESAFEDSDLPYAVDIVDVKRIAGRFREIVATQRVLLPMFPFAGASLGRADGRAKTSGTGLGIARREEWTTVRLGDVADLLTGFPFRSDCYVSDSEAPRLLRGDNVAQGRLRWNGAKRWSAEAAVAMEPFWLSEGDVVLAMDRPWIEAGLKFASVHRSDLPALLVQRVARLRGGEDLDTQFLRYVIGGRDFSDYVLSVQTGTAVPHITARGETPRRTESGQAPGWQGATREHIGHIRARSNAASRDAWPLECSGAFCHGLISARQIEDYEFHLPPLRHQRAIAHILGTLDDKINLNRQMNATLEAMARALFKSWFVDFDPVRAMMEGRDTGLPKEIADLFPDRLVDSELGEIPLGWSVESLADHFEAVKGVSYKGSGLTGDGTPLHNLNSIHEGGGYKYEGIKFYSGEYADRHRVRPGDVIVANTEQGHDRLLIGYAAIVPGLFGTDGIVSHHIYRLRPRTASWLSTRFLLLLLNSARMHDLVSGYANGTTVNMLPIDGVQRPALAVPPRALVDAFDVVASCSEQRHEQAVRESRTLTVVREALLPRLVSGEIRVADAEKLVGGTA